MRHLKYLWYVIRHKWYVFLECWKLGIVWQGIWHDWSKFLPDEWIAYVDYFYGGGNGNIKRGRDETGYYKPGEGGNEVFDLAWLRHQHRNPHHWQWWVLIQDEDEDKVLPMLDKYQREMLADWRGAGKAQGTPDAVAWYCKNGNKMRLHPMTRQWIEEQLGLI